MPERQELSQFSRGLSVSSTRSIQRDSAIEGAYHQLNTERQLTGETPDQYRARKQAVQRQKNNWPGRVIPAEQQTTSEDEPEVERLERVLKEYQNGIETVQEQLEIARMNRDKVKRGKRPAIFDTPEEGTEQEVQESLTERFAARSVMIDRDKFPNWEDYQQALEEIRLYELDRFGTSYIPNYRARRSDTVRRAAHQSDEFVSPLMRNDTIAPVIERNNSREGRRDTPVRHVSIQPPSREYANRANAMHHPIISDEPRSRDNRYPSVPTLRGITPQIINQRYSTTTPSMATAQSQAIGGAAKYENEIVRRITNMIHSRVGLPMAYTLDEIKHIKPPAPKSYNGEDDIEVFEAWLADILRWFRVTGMAGPDKDPFRVDLCGIYLTGIASTWYNTEVEAWERTKINWTFEELIIALYKRFIHEVTAQNAKTHYENTRYSKTKGALAFYNELERHAKRMIQRPDEYSHRRRFLFGLPMEIVETMIKSRGITAEHTPIEEMIEEAKAVENTIQAMEYYRHQKTNHTPSKAVMTTQPLYKKTDKSVKFSSNSRYPTGKKYRPNPTGYKTKNTIPLDKTQKSNVIQSSRPIKNNSAQTMTLPSQKGIMKPPERLKESTNDWCFRCGRFGHYAINCPSNQRSRVNAMDAVEESEDNKPTAEVNAVQIEEQDNPENQDTENQTEPDDNVNGSQYESDQEFEHTLEQYEDYNGYEVYPADSIDEDEHEPQIRVMSIEEESERGITTPQDSHNPSINMHKIMPEDSNTESIIRSSLRRVMGEMKRPPRNPEETLCLRAFISINGIKALVLFDTGSTTDAVSNDFARVAQLPLYTLEKPITLKLGCVGSRSNVVFGTIAKAVFETKSANTYFDVANIDQYDIIMGIPYMTRNKITLDVANKTIIIDGKMRIAALPHIKQESLTTKTLNFRSGKSSNTRQKPNNTS